MVEVEAAQPVDLVRLPEKCTGCGERFHDGPQYIGMKEPNALYLCARCAATLLNTGQARAVEIQKPAAGAAAA